MKQFLPLALLTSSLGAAEFADFQVSLGHMPEEHRTFGSVALNGSFYADEKIRQKIGIEFIYFEEEIDEFLDTDLESPIIAFNYQIEFKSETDLTFYLGAGLGIQMHSLESDIGTLGDYNTEYAQFFGGLSYQISELTSVRLGVRRMFLGDFEITGVDGDPQHQWAFEFGFNMRF